MDDVLMMLFLAAIAMRPLWPILWNAALRRLDISDRPRHAAVIALSVASMLTTIAGPWVVGAALHGTLYNFAEPKIWPGLGTLLGLAAASEAWLAVSFLRREMATQ